MSEDVVAVFIPIIAIVMSLLIPIVYAIVDYRRRKDIVEAHHESAWPPSSGAPTFRRCPSRSTTRWQRNRRPRTLLTGMIWFFVGIGLFIALGKVAGDDVKYFGLIPAGVGLAFLIYYAIEGRKEPVADDCHGPAGCPGPSRLTGTPGRRFRTSATGLARLAWRDQD